MTKTITAYAVVKPIEFGKGWIVFKGWALEEVRKHYPKAAVALVSFEESSPKTKVLHWV